VKDLDRQVVTLLPKQLLRFLLEDDSGPVMRVDDVVSLRKIALRGLQLGACPYRFFD
jgi:hypothetical protein